MFPLASIRDVTEPVRLIKSSRLNLFIFFLCDVFSLCSFYFLRNSLICTQLQRNNNRIKNTDHENKANGLFFRQTKTEKQKRCQSITLQPFRCHIHTFVTEKKKRETSTFTHQKDSHNQSAGYFYGRRKK